MLELSIVIPYYNGEEYIKKTIETVKQIDCNKEIIIVDDGSSEDSHDYCKCIVENDSDIKFVRKENGGIDSARNKGLNIAEGKYVLFVDQDDICLNKGIEKALYIAINNDYDIVFWSTKWLLENDNYQELSSVFYEREYSKKEIREQVLNDLLFNVDNKCISYMGNVWAAIYRRDMICDNNITFKKYIDIEDDYIFVFDSLLCSERIYTLKDVGYIWRYNKESETYRVKYIDNIVRKYKEFYKYISSKLIEYNIEKHTIDKFYIFFTQDSMVRSYENEYTLVADSKDSRRELDTYYKDSRDVMKKKSVYRYNKRRKRVFILLNHNMLFLTKLYIFLDSVYRRIKKR